MTDVQIKLREFWDNEDRLDFLDGWHEESDAHFHSPRDQNRQISFIDPNAAPRQDIPHAPGFQSMADWIAANRLTHGASALMAEGRAARAAHREATGL